MKKKLIAFVIALSACFSMTSCDKVKGALGNLPIIGNLINKNSSSSEPLSQYDLDGAKNLVETLVKTSNAESREEYEVPASVQLLGVSYQVDWSVNVDSVKIEKEDGKVYVNVYEASLSLEDVPFVLTAKITAPDNTSIETKMNRIVPKLEREVPIKISEPAENTEYRLNVYQGNNKKDIYIDGEMENTYYFRTTEKYDSGIGVYVEYVANSQTDFYLYHLVDVVAQEGQEAHQEKEYINVVKSGTHINVIYGNPKDYEGTLKTPFYFDAELTTIATKVSGETYYLGCDGTYNTVEPQNVVGPDYFAAHLVTKVDRTQVPNEDKVKHEKDTLTLAPAYIGGGESAKIITHGDRYPDVKIAWTSNSDVVSIKRNVISFNATETTQDVTLTATLTIGETTQTRDITFKVVPNNAEAILEAAKEFNSNEAFGNDVTLTGVVLWIDEEFDPQYDSVSFVMWVNDDTRVIGYRTKGDGANEVAPGYTVTLSGKLMLYKDSIEFSFANIESYTAGTADNLPDTGVPAYGSTLTIPEVLALDLDKYGNEKYYVEGVVSKIANSTHGNIYIKDADGNELYVYGTYDGNGNKFSEMEEKPAVGDTVKYFGIVTEYNDVNQLKNADVTIVKKAEVPTVTTAKISDILANKDGGSYKAEGTIIATCYHGFVLQDSTANIFVYKAGHTYTAGTKVLVEGNTTVYNKGMQFDKPTVTENGTGTLPTGAPTVLSVADCEALVASEFVSCTYVSLTATLTISGNYYNLVIDGTTKAQGSVYGVTDAQKALLTPLKDKTVTIEGYVTAIASGKYINLIMTNIAEYVKPITDADRVTTELNAIEVDTTVVAEKTFTLSTTPTTYDNVSISWKKDGVALTGDALTFTLTPGAVGSEDVTVELEATVTCGDATQTKTFTIIVKAVDPQTFVDAEKEAFTLTSNVATVVAPLTLPTTTANGAAITWAIKDGDAVTAITVASNPAANETVTLVATFTAGSATATKEFTVTKKALTPAEVVDALYALGENETLPGTYTLTGVITKAGAYSTQYSNIEVTISVEGKDVVCYRMKGTGADVIGVGDTITVTGKLTHYFSSSSNKHSYQFAQDCQLTSYEICNANKANAELNKIQLPTAIKEETTLTFVTAGTTYTDVAISWMKDGVAYTEGTLTLTPGTEDVYITLLAVVTIDGVEIETKEFKLVVKAPAADGTVEYTTTQVTSINSLEKNKSYLSGQTTDNWTYTNAAIHQGSVGAANANNGDSNMVADTNLRAVVLNGKTSAVGSLASPTLSGGLSQLTFNYGFSFSEANGVDLTITIAYGNGQTVTKVLKDTAMTQHAAKLYTLDLSAENITGDFTITITNNSPSNNSTSNKDRTSIWNIAWTDNPSA